MTTRTSAPSAIALIAAMAPAAPPPMTRTSVLNTLVSGNIIDCIPPTFHIAARLQDGGCTPWITLMFSPALYWRLPALQIMRTLHFLRRHVNCLAHPALRPLHGHEMGKPSQARQGAKNGVRGFGLDRRTPILERFWMVSMQSSFLYS